MPQSCSPFLNSSKSSDLLPSSSIFRNVLATEKKNEHVVTALFQKRWLARDVYLPNPFIPEAPRERHFSLSFSMGSVVLSTAAADFCFSSFSWRLKSAILLSSAQPLIAPQSPKKVALSKKRQVTYALGGGGKSKISPCTWTRARGRGHVDAGTWTRARDSEDHLRMRKSRIARTRVCESACNMANLKVLKNMHFRDYWVSSIGGDNRRNRTG